MKKQIFQVAVILFLLTTAIVVTTRGALSNDRLSELHQEELRIEEVLTVKKTERTSLQQQLNLVEEEIIKLRTERAVIVNERNAIINKHTEKLPLEAAPSATNLTPNNNTDVNMDALAYAIAMAETANCTKGYGAEYSNCFGIKNGSIAPCEKIGRNRMCIYTKPEESYVAFKAIWTKGYSGQYPSYKAAQVWTGGDRPDNWLKNVRYYYDLQNK